MRNAKDVPIADSDVQQKVRSARELLRHGQAERADRECRMLLDHFPRHPDVLALAAEIQLSADEPELALELIERAVAQSPPSLSLLSQKAYVLMAMMRRCDAKRVAELIANSAEGQARALWMAGSICSRCDDPVAAERYFSQAAEAGIRAPELLYDLAASEFFLGKFDQAEAHLDALLTQVPAAGDAMYLRSTLRRQTLSRNHIAQLNARLKAGFDNPLDAAGCLYALAKEHEDLGNNEQSIAALIQGAALKRSTLRYDLRGECEAIDGIRRAYGAATLQSEGGGQAQDTAIFIVGLPRTGTTLLERMLARHTGTVSAGELPYFGGALASAAHRRMVAGQAGGMIEASLRIDFAALGRSYLEGARQAVDQAEGIVIDKMPINFMYCGLIRKALPNARIIHLVRDPMDACYAVFKTLFPSAYHYSYDLQELATYYATYDRLVRHWRNVMPGGLLDVRYEDLVSDKEEQMRRVLAWCGLEWQPGVLEFSDDQRPSSTASAAQVRDRVHSNSIGKWRRYAARLEPLRRHLADAGIAV